MRRFACLACLAMLTLCASSVSATENWESRSGKVTRGVFIELNDSSVRLGNPSTGRTHDVPFEKLSEASLQQARELQQRVIEGSELYTRGMSTKSTSPAAAIVHFRAGARKGSPFCYLEWGLAEVKNQRDFKSAQKHFDEAARLAMSQAQFSEDYRYLLISALNNSALAKSRLRNRRAALRTLSRIAEFAKGDLPPEVTHNVETFARIYAGFSDVQEDLAEVQAALPVSKLNIPYSPVGWVYMVSKVYSQANEGSSDAKEPAPNNLFPEVAGSTPVAAGTGIVVADGIVLTNRHVVELYRNVDAAKLVVVDPPTIDEEEPKGLQCEILAKSDELDLAIVRVEGLTATPLELLPSELQLGQQIVVLGYPQIDSLGQSLTVNTGAVSKLPHPQNDNMYLFDASANPGNSGGPIIATNGQVGAVLTLVKRGDVTWAASKFSGGIPILQAAKFLVGNGVEPRMGDENSVELSGTEITEKCRGGVVLVLVYSSPHKKFEVDVREFEEQAQRGKRDTAPPTYEFQGMIDTACALCNGLGTEDCTNRVCSRGLITKKVPVAEQRSNGSIIKLVPVQTQCSFCGGRGIVKCRRCQGTKIDSEFR